MLTLAVTSSTAVVGAALVEHDRILGVEHVATDRRHAEELVPLIARVVAESGLDIGDVDRLAVDVGPGRFTGLRVGVTTVRSLAFALGAPVVAVTSLEALARSRPDQTIAAVVDARRGEVFQQRFDRGRPVDDPAVGPPAVLAARLAEGELAIGDGADRYPDDYRRRIADQAPRAELIGLLSSGREPQPGPQIEPVYLRAPDVQINIRTRHDERVAAPLADEMAEP